MNNLSGTIAIVNSLREKLKLEYDLEEDDQVLIDSLEGASDLNEQVARIAREALLCEAQAKGIHELIKDTLLRKSRLEHKAERLRALVKWSLEESGVKKVAAADMTLSLSAGKPPLLIDEDAVLPDRLTRIKREPDRAAIRAAIEHGEEVAGVRLGNASMTLTIRRG